MRKLELDPTKTVLTITVGFLIVYLFTGWTWTIVTSLVVGIIGVFSSRLSGLINKLWIQLTIILSYIVPTLIMAIIYYLFLVPIAFLSRIVSKKDELLLKQPGKSTFFDVNRSYKKDSLEKMW
jgi:hypothetical protein